MLSDNNMLLSGGDFLSNKFSLKYNPKIIDYYSKPSTHKHPDSFFEITKSSVNFEENMRLFRLTT